MSDYLIPKRVNSQKLRDDAEKVEEHPISNVMVESGASLYLRDESPYIDKETDETIGQDGYSHDVSFLHVPAKNDDWIAWSDNVEDYAIFITNRQDLKPQEAVGFTNRYSNRWDIENEYKTVPRSPSRAGWRQRGPAHTPDQLESTTEASRASPVGDGVRLARSRRQGSPRW